MSRPLTPRQREIVALLAEGLPNRLIAKRLGLKTATIENHIFAAGVNAGVGQKLQVGLVSWHYRQRIAELETVGNILAGTIILHCDEQTSRRVVPKWHAITNGGSK